VRVYDCRPASGVTPIRDAVEIDAGNLDLSDSGGVRIAKVRRHLGYKRLWWNIRRIAPGGRTAYSAVQSVRVVPRPLIKASATTRAVRKLGSSSRKPGTVRLAVTSSPLAKVTVRVTRGGRSVARRSWTETVGGARSVTFSLSCAQTGDVSVCVTMKDAYGTSVSRNARGRCRGRGARPCDSVKRPSGRPPSASATGSRREAPQAAAAIEQRNRLRRQPGAAPTAAGRPAATAIPRRGHTRRSPVSATVTATAVTTRATGSAVSELGDEIWFTCEGLRASRSCVKRKSVRRCAKTVSW
jgi:hypothetical protein